MARPATSVLDLPELVVERVFRHLIDFRVLEWFEDPDYLGTWGLWAEMVVPLLGVCRYWRSMACPLYYQYAAGCYGAKHCSKIRQACKRARVDEITTAYHRSLVRHVYLCFGLEDLLRDGLQGVLDRRLGGAVFPLAQQLFVVVDETGAGAVGPGGVRPEALRRIDQACGRLRAMFPGAVAVEVGGTSRAALRPEIVALSRGMLRGRPVVAAGHRSYTDFVAPALGAGGLTWIKVDQVHMCAHALELVRRSAATLQTVIFVMARPDFARRLARTRDGAPLAYPRLRELRLGLLDARPEPAALEPELPESAPFPALARVSAVPRDSGLGALVLRGGSSAALAQVRLFLSGRSVTEMRAAGLLDRADFPALRHIELHRTAYHSSAEAAENGPGSMSAEALADLVCWALAAGRRCSRIVMCGWRMRIRLRLDPPGGRGAQVLGALLRASGALQRLELPVALALGDALRLIGALPHLGRLGVSLADDDDDCGGGRQQRQQQPAAAAPATRLRRLAVPVGCTPAEQQRDMGRAWALAALVPSVQALEPRVEYGDVPLRDLDPAAIALGLPESLGPAPRTIGRRVAVEPRSAEPPWL
ncbi:hypothetical protein H4R18_003701 [Coemansia javaensis]|uniref:Uncharacterized protein n=1 Tax=Coemansia javaensis TaxID=2761396 RepID=A0A9W8LHA4_9FUNG|nr:hypothetical protein H4R18_003701 [Coemansia javaensis]